MTSMSLSPEVFDALLSQMEDCFCKLAAAQESVVQRPKAELDLLVNLEEARDFMEKILRMQGSRSDLENIFGGDCMRISRTRAVLEAADFSDMNAEDQRLSTCWSVCESVEKVILDLGLGMTLRRAQEQQRQVLQQKGLSECDSPQSEGQLNVTVLNLLGEELDLQSTKEDIDIVKGSSEQSVDHQRHVLQKKHTNFSEPSCEIELDLTGFRESFLEKNTSHPDVVDRISESGANCAENARTSFVLHAEPALESEEAVGPPRPPTHIVPHPELEEQDSVGMFDNAALKTASPVNTPVKMPVKATPAEEAPKEAAKPTEEAPKEEAAPPAAEAPKEEAKPAEEAPKAIVPVVDAAPSPRPELSQQASVPISVLEPKLEFLKRPASSVKLQQPLNARPLQRPSWTCAENPTPVERPLSPVPRTTPRSPAPLNPMSQWPSAQQALSYVVGQKASYFSDNKRNWFECTVSSLNADGSVTVNIAGAGVERCIPRERLATHLKAGGGNIIHHDVRCDGCGQLPIVSKRFKAANKDYDLCGKCMAAPPAEAAAYHFDECIITAHAAAVPAPVQASFSWPTSPRPSSPRPTLQVNFSRPTSPRPSSPRPTLQANFSRPTSPQPSSPRPTLLQGQRTSSQGKFVEVPVEVLQGGSRKLQLLSNMPSAKTLTVPVELAGRPRSPSRVMQVQTGLRDRSLTPSRSPSHALQVQAGLHTASRNSLHTASRNSLHTASLNSLHFTSVQQPRIQTTQTVARSQPPAVVEQFV